VTALAVAFDPAAAAVAAPFSGVDLVAALRARDPRAARAAWSQLAPLVRRTLRRFRDAGADREDLCQEVFLRFFARIDELRNDRALRSFLFGICVGVAQNDRRRARLRRAVALCPPDELPDVLAVRPDPEAHERAARLRAVLASARPGDARLFWLRYAEGMELRELAASVGVSLSTLRRRLSVAMRRLGQRLRADPALAELAAALDIGGDAAAVRAPASAPRAAARRGRRAQPPAPEAQGQD
jgi:RNA polymerase sigma-70 factor (ECF subfamily)